MRNICMAHWTKGFLAAILATFRIAVPAFGQEANHEEKLATELRQARIASQAAETRYLDATAALQRQREEAEKARHELAKAYLELKELRDRDAALHLQAASVLASQARLDEAAASLQCLRDLRESNRRLGELYQQLQDYQRTVEAALELGGIPSGSPERDLLAGKMQLLLRQVQESERLTALSVAVPAPADRCQVLSVNRELAVAVLDAGREQGLRPGSIWTVPAPAGDALQLRIVEVRQTLSAALVLAGELDEVRPGAVATRQQPGGVPANERNR